MKKILIFIIVLFFLSSCSNKTKKEVFLIPKENIQIILDAFVQKNMDKHYTIYELYIDKIDPGNYNMILYAGNESFTKKENEIYNQQSLVCVVSHGIKISIYSGMERYFSNSFSKETNYLQRNNEKSYNLLAIQDSFGVLHTYEISTAYPFIPLPLENKENTFSLPILEE